MFSRFIILYHSLSLSGDIFVEHKDKAIALHIKQLFHCPNRSLEEAIGQNRLNGIIKATATNTLSGLRFLAK
jgi:hypothetical protein